MINGRPRRSLLAFGLIFWSSNNFLAAQDAPGDALKIIVLDGEDAVNIVKKKTAVQPVVEVRDQNNLPVAGASVLFLLPSNGPGGTFPNGSKSLTVTTNALGRATASDFDPVGAGAFVIDVLATFRGHEVHEKIRQTNYLTAAAAASAGVAAGSTAATIGGGAIAIGAVATAAAASVSVGIAYANGAVSCLSACK